MGASHPGYISYCPAQLLWELPLEPMPLVPTVVRRSALPVGGEFLDASIRFRDSLPRSCERSCHRLTFVATAVIACDSVLDVG